MIYVLQYLIARTLLLPTFNEEFVDTLFFNAYLQ